MAERIDTVVIGAGQAGLAISNELSQRGCEHVVLERRRIAERWRTERWDSLCFQFPNSHIHMPGLAYDGPDPEGFAHYSAIVAFLEAYAARIAAPVRAETEVVSLKAATRGYLVQTTDGQIGTQNVVIATGPFQRAHRPAFAQAVPTDLYQVDAAHYRNPEELPPGAVLVVGSAVSGCQIAEELLESGRRVYLAVSRHKRVPRRFGDRDVIWWFEQMGRLDVQVDSFPGRKYPPSTVITGVGGGHDVDVRRFAEAGVQVVGHLNGVAGGMLSLDRNANQILDEADQTCRDFVSAARATASRLGLAVPADDAALYSRTRVDERETLDLRATGIGSVVWATGYRFDYPWLQLPILDAGGAPIQTRGVTPCPGVYFLGLHWMHTFKSGLLPYISEDAAYTAGCIEAGTMRPGRSGFP